MMYPLKKYGPLKKVGHMGSKIRSLGQILEKSLKHIRGNMYGLIFIKLDQNVFLDELFDIF